MWVRELTSHSVRVGIVFISMLFFSAVIGQAETISVDLPLTTPGNQNNLSLTLTARYGSTVKNGTDTTSATGNMQAALEVTFDPLTHQVQEVTGLTFMGGSIQLSDVSFTLDYGLILGKIIATGNTDKTTHW